MAYDLLDKAAGSTPGELDASHLYGLLDRLSAAMFTRLYASPASCLSIFRLLPVTSRHIVLNMLWYEEVVRVRDVALWVRERKSEGGDKGERRHLSSSLSALARLHIITPRSSRPSDTSKDETELEMNPGFRDSFRMALTGGGKQGSFGAPAAEQDEEVTVQFLDDHAEVQWETIQHFMVGSDAGAKKPGEKVLSLLERSGLMYSPTRSLRNMRITSKGFQFLLEDVNTQLWDLLLVYLEGSQDLVETIGFLFMLGSLELGRAYMTDNLSQIQHGVLRDLADYGLVYLPERNAPIFYPTRLATTLTSSAPPLVSSRHSNEEKGFIVLETNYKLYAYTSNPLQIAVLGLFAHLKTRFANFVTGHITRESIRRGLANGITANQIISYLASRAHPQMRAQAGSDDKLLPITVVDQIRLWEHERRRIQTTEGYLYDEFSSTHDYELVVNYAREIGSVLLELPKARKVFVTADGHQQVREFIKRRMAAAQAEAQAMEGQEPA
ncbi:RNA polymerase II transcription factor B subunit 2 [Rhodotorula toruloides ATCC 204091]|uniref:RNA polymerase II transcription factor B subunit 2 n=1 Tax=Rhodotorula toruloides TaxID=5286 RepID=A0A0K3CAA7_RHOTO|nr:RNA polymerase II transcription factor B subunit 2 [Rhodotorula toruloides ATCC 204091]PRQ75828.1 RNA polymerase II transcription factor B subunit 2 [Rhodotorula toruloides]